MSWPSLIMALAFGLAAMAPIVGIVLVGLAASPRWRAAATLAAPVAVVAGAGCALSWFFGLRTAVPSPLSAGVSSLIAFGAGFSAGGLLALLSCAVRLRLSGPGAKTGARDGARPSS